MDLDTLARSATRELLEQPTPDLAERYAALRRTRTRRTAARAVGVAAALGLAVGTWQLTGTEDQRPEPAPRPAEVVNGTLMAPKIAGLDQYDSYQYAWSAVLGEPIDGLPGDISGTLLQFSRDGSELFYTKSHRITARDLASGTDRPTVDCLQPCDAKVSPDGSTMAYSGPGSFRLQGLESRQVTLVETGLDRLGTPSWSPDGTRLAFSGFGGLYTVALDGSDLQLVHPATDPGDLVTDVAWSPDGSRIAFFDTEVLQHQEIFDVRYTAMTVAPDGTSPTVLHDAGHCFCLDRAPPSLSWSPDGELVAVATTDLGRLLSGVYTVRADGSEWTQIARGRFGRPAWQPITQ